MTTTPMMNVKEVAQLFSVSAGTVRRWEYEGKLKAVRLGGLLSGPVRFTMDAVNQFIAKNEAERAAQ